MKMLSSVFRLAPLFLFFGSYASAEERALPQPFEVKLGGEDHVISFCTEVEPLRELFQQHAYLAVDARKKKGCGVMFIPIVVTVKPLEWIQSYPRVFIAQITDHFGEEAFITVEVVQQFAEYSLGVEN